MGDVVGISTADRGQDVSGIPAAVEAVGALLRNCTVLVMTARSMADQAAEGELKAWQRRLEVRRDELEQQAASDANSPSLPLLHFVPPPALVSPVEVDDDDEPVRLVASAAPVPVPDPAGEGENVGEDMPGGR